MTWTTMALQALATMAIAVLPVTVRTNSGDILEGELNGFDDSAVQLVESGIAVDLPYDDLLSLEPTEPIERVGPDYRVLTVGGSRIAAEGISLARNELFVSTRQQNELRIPVKQVKSIRFRKANAATDAKWLGIVQQERRGDSLVIRRGDDRLDPQSGVIEEISDGKIRFNLDGDIVNAPIDRLEGVVFGGTQPVAEGARIEIRDVWESRWSVARIGNSGGDGPIPMQLADGITHDLPIDQLHSIRWTGGIWMLASEVPATSSTNPSFPANVDSDLVDSLFGPQGQQGGDLIVSGGSTVEYRIEPGSGFRTLTGLVRRHPSVRRAGKLLVRIKLDDQVVWEEPLPDAEPRGFELPVESARRVAIEVDSAGDGDLGDRVRFTRPRLVK